jgi:membrane-anchored protein YejM (alkaline phosphatase superfamily)
MEPMSWSGLLINKPVCVISRKPPVDKPTRNLLFRWMGWFALANAIVLAVVGLRYFQGFSAGGTALSWIYLLLVYPAHHVLLAVLPLFLLVAPLVWLRPSRKFATTLAVILFALMIAIITLDSLLWAQSRFHLNGLTVQILGWSSWVFVGVILLIALFFESLLAGWVWQWVKGKNGRKGGLISVLLITAIVSSQLLHAWADAAYYVPVTSVGQQLPVYSGITAKKQLVALGLVDPEASRERQVARRMSQQLADRDKGALNYPLQPLRCSVQQPLNVLLIVADALRWDIVEQTTMPFLSGYGDAQGLQFLQHFSGGNSSRMGVFSLFYGLPPGYWASFESMQRSSVLIDELQRQGYQLGLFSSATLYRPVTLDRTAFANVADLRLQTEPAEAPAWERDQTMLQDWQHWLEQRDPGTPFFGFLFFDATNAQEYPTGLASDPDLQPPDSSELSVEFSNYRRSARFVDGLLGKTIGDLEKRGLADNTVVVITSDHGEEFDESGAGLRDHGSGYTRYQLQVPLVIRWPGRESARYVHRSSHYDIVPTLMQDVLGCDNATTDYSSGNNLFAEQGWDWLLAGSYYNYAVLEPDQITVTYPNGQYEVRDWDYRILSEPEVRGDVLMAVTRENSRFYR